MMHNKNKNARPAGSAAERAAAVQIKTTTLQNKYTTPHKPEQGFVASLLPQGEANALSSRKLVQLTGFRSVRDLQNEIAREREAGALILSTCRNGGGYFLPADGEAGQCEISAFVATLQARAINTMRALKPAREVLQTLDGQVSLSDFEGV